MQQNSVFNHFFKDENAIEAVDRFNLNRKARSKRLRQIYAILWRFHFLRGFSPVEFRMLLEELGPSFVKIGQTLSTRSEILPEAYCKELARLQTESKPLPFDEVLDALRSIYGDKLEKTFAEIDPRPLGSASLAQVHKAWLKNGDVVAVKVQRPNVKDVMAQDIDIMRTLARRFSRFNKEEQMVDFVQVVEEIWDTFLEETDFVCEANNLVLFKELNKDVVFVDCPHVYYDLCSEYCLVMEYIDGISLNNREELERCGYDMAEIGEKILDNYAAQILDHGFFHADPHPGNILIREGKIIYIDLGIMGRLNPQERAGFNTIIEAVGLQDPGMLKDALISFAVSCDNKTVDHSMLLSDLDLMLNTYGSCDVTDLDIGQLLNDIIAVTLESKVVLPSSVANVSRGIVSMEGTIADYIPNESMISIINAHILRSGDPIKQVKDYSEEVLFELRKASEGAAKAAEYSGEALKMLTRGQLRLNMEMLGSQSLMDSMAKIFNRLAIGIVIAGLFIGSSSLINIPSDITILNVPILSFFGFLGAFLLSVWLFIDIIRKR